MKSRQEGFGKRLLALAVVGGALLWSSSALAISGQCSNCHTMHDSQNNNIVAVDGPNAALLRDDCVGCHTGGGLAVDFLGTPMVGHSSAPTETLAGGSFYWVAQGDVAADYKGHNVVGIADADTLLTTPPGFGSGEAAPDGSTPGSDWAANQLTCAGTYGCHGSHSTPDQYGALNGAHHANEGGNVSAGELPGTGFRFLQGIKGNEDDDWENTVSASDHNQYSGVHAVESNQTISALCARCHGNFHGVAGETQNGNGAWIRHPSDYDLGATASGSEYRAYNGAADAASAPYSPIAPVGSVDTSAVLSTVNISSQAGQGIVLCLSCHRAHGSEHNDLLRWEYNDMVAGGGAGNTGCFICHTTKD